MENKMEEKIKLTQEQITELLKVSDISKSLGLDDLFISSDIISASHPEDARFALINSNTIPGFTYTAFITRVRQFNSRLNMIVGDKNCKVEMTVLNDSVQSFKMSGNSMNIIYRCGMPSVAKVKKNTADIFKFKMMFTSNDLHALLQGKDAVVSKAVCLSGKSDGFFEIVDDNNDNLVYKLENKIINLDTKEVNEDSFSNIYSLDVMLNILKLVKGQSEFEIRVGQRGFLWINIHNLGVIVAPKL